MLVDQNLTSLLLRSSPSDTSVSRTFDYSDLTAFLLMVLGVMDASHASNMSTASFQDLVKKAREGDHNIPVKLVGDIGAKDPFIAFPETECLARVVEKMASGVHRIAVTRENGNDVIGVLSQRKVIKFFWENVRAFIDIEHLYQKTVKSIHILSNVTDWGTGYWLVKRNINQRRRKSHNGFGIDDLPRNLVHCGC